MRPFSARLFPDTVVVDPAGAARTLACSVQPVSDNSDTSRQETHLAVESVTRYCVLSQADPGVALADVLLHWTANGSGALAPPVVLTSLGPARPPAGLKTRWSLDCQSRV